MPRARWLTPNTPASGFICRRIIIPNGLDWLAIVTGALNELIYAYNFEEYGSSSPDVTAVTFMDMFNKFCFDDDPGCRLIGEIVTFAGPSNPSARFLPADGASYLRSDYPDLFTVIGTIYGAADSTHFNVPDLQGRIPVGVGSGSGLSTYTLGQVGGEETHVLTGAELASHSHSDTGHVHSEVTAVPSIGAAITGVPVPSAIPGVGVTGVGNANISPAGSDAPHNNIQPYLALNCYIVAL
jgi:microcystin-dependent protein